MRRIQIYIEEDLDEALQAEAVQTGRSKAALIRECVSSRYSGAAPIERDPMTALVGAVDAEPAEVDEVVYGRDLEAAALVRDRVAVRAVQ